MFVSGSEGEGLDGIAPSIEGRGVSKVEGTQLDGGISVVLVGGLKVGGGKTVPFGFVGECGVEAGTELGGGILAGACGDELGRAKEGVEVRIVGIVGVGSVC
jgi:hypothetical protein